MFNLKGKKALVTGASRGIGKGIALSLAKAGASVAVNYHSKGQEAEAVVAEVKKLGVDSFSVQTDVSNKEQVAKMFEEVKNKFGQLNILVNNAGIVYMNPIDKITEEEWDKVLNTNLKGQFFCIQEAIKIMPAGGKIINISSIASGGVGVGFGNIVHYAASKGGVKQLTMAFSNEWANKGVTINAIAPGYIATANTKALREDPVRNKSILDRIPAGRWGIPEDLMGTIVFLCSDASNYLNGTVVTVDGGWMGR